MRIAALNALNAYNVVRFLCADEETPGRRPNYVLVVPSINRTLMEILFTVIYLLEDFPQRADFYQKAGWR